MIIFLNGTSSSGKSTVSEILLQRLGDGWLYFNMDDYLSMLGPKFFGLHPDNKEITQPNDVCYAKKHADGTYEIITGELCSRLFSTIPDVLALLAVQGFNIIVDSFITTMAELNSYKEKLNKYNFFCVYLNASENVITVREELRGNRLKGSAIHWLKKIECKDAFDLKINTDENSPHDITQIIFSEAKLSNAK